MHKTAMIPLNSILKDVYLLLRDIDVKEDLIMEFAIRALEHLSVYNFYQHQVCILRVDNHQTPFPHGMLGIESVLYKNVDEVDKDVKVFLTEQAILKIDKSHNLIEVELDYRVQDFQQLHVSNQSRGWRYINISSSPFDRAILCNPQLSIQQTCSAWVHPETNKSRFLTSFAYGYLAVAYYQYPQDQDGNFLIPDFPLIKDAVQAAVMSKTFERLYLRSVQGAQEKYMHYSNMWEKLSAAAIGELMKMSQMEIVDNNKINTIFKSTDPTKIYGGWGSENLNLR